MGEKITNLYLSESKEIKEEIKEYEFNPSDENSDSNYFHL
jgi:hypothetical protein